MVKLTWMSHSICERFAGDKILDKKILVQCQQKNDFGANEPYRRMPTQSIGGLTGWRIAAPRRKRMGYSTDHNKSMIVYAMKADEPQILQFIFWNVHPST